MNTSTLCCCTLCGNKFLLFTTIGCSGATCVLQILIKCYLNHDLNAQRDIILYRSHYWVRNMGKTSKSRHDTAVQGTNDNSIVSKSSCAAHQYVDDKFVWHFAAKHPNRSPLINRSYYIRYVAVECVISSFLHTFKDRKKQILNLGAGFDALYFNLKTKGKLDNTTYIEVDYKDVMERKSSLITHTPELLAVLDLYQGPYKEGVVLQGSDYIAIGADLTKLPALEKILHGLNIDYDTPTLLMSEVVLTYLPADKSSGVLGWAASTFPHAVFWSYEQIKPHDGFGQVMMNHFTKLGSPLQTILTYPTMQHQVERHCAQRGWEECVVTDLNYLYHHYLPREERRRVSQLEPFDEWEEWTLASGHYMVMTAVRGDANNIVNEMKDKLKMGGMLDLKGGKLGDGEKVAQNVKANSDIEDFSTNHGHAYHARKTVAFPPKPNTVISQNNHVKNQASTVSDSLHLVQNTQIADTEAVYFRRFGHTACQVGKNICIIGGFGEHKNGHSRVKNLTVYDTDSNAITNYNDFTSLERVFGSCTPLEDGRILVFGGRLSPQKPCATLVFLTEMEGGWKEDVIDVKEENLLRRRHTTNAVMLQGQQHVLVYGGCSVTSATLDDLWAYDVENGEWKQLETSGRSQPTGRHSHTTALYQQSPGEHQLIVACGLGEDETALSCVWRLRLTGLVWEEIDTQGDLQPRYSHSADIVGSRLFLLGGVAFTSQQPGLTIVDLDTGTLRDFALPDHNPLSSPVLLYGHQVAYSGDRDHRRHLLVIGGGGNCFSFGTHFNQLHMLQWE